MARTKKDDKSKKKEDSPKMEGIAAKKKSQNYNNQRWAIVIFAFGILTLLMTLIKGSAGWMFFHNFMLGLFGIAVISVPVILIYCAVQISMEKNRESILTKVILGICLAFIVSAAIQIFLMGEVPGDTFSECFSKLYESGISLKGGGIASAIIALPLLKFFGGFGAKIVILLIMFVFVMLVSGKGLLDFFHLFAKPFNAVKNIADGIQEIIVGGGFDDEYFDDDVDDDLEKEQFDADLEAIDLVNNRKPTLSTKEPVVLKPLDETDASVPMKSISYDEGGFLDIPLPTDHLLKNETPEVHEEKHDMGTDDSLEMLISKAADVKPHSVEDEVGTDNSGNKANDKPLYILPPLDLLSMPHIMSSSAEAAAEMREKADAIVNTLRSFGVEVKIKDIFRGPSITRYEIEPGIGVKISKIRGLEDDIALCLAAQGVRIEAPVPGKKAVGIEIPNATKDMVTLREILSAPEFKDSESKLTFAVGKDITGETVIGDIAKMPHVIIAGTTGSGKSVCTRSIIMSILYNASPDEVKLILIDPKMVEFKVFDGIPHLLIPIVIEAKRAAGALNWAVNEMMRRYTTFADLGANDIKSYNEIAADENNDLEKMPQIVVFIDELADMMIVAGKEVETSICRLAQMGRASGVHLVVATQRPTTDVITGLIKANIPSRIALSVKSHIDSRTIIDMPGADKLLGNGDMLYMPIGMAKPVRVQGCFASNQDIASTLEYIKSQVTTEYDNDIIEAVDSLIPQGKGDDEEEFTVAAGTDEDFVERAIEVAVQNGQLSTSMLQRKLKLGYARAARIMDELEDIGVIGPSEGAKPRKVLMTRMQFDERRLRMKE